MGNMGVKDKVNKRPRNKRNATCLNGKPNPAEVGNRLHREEIGKKTHRQDKGRNTKKVNENMLDKITPLAVKDILGKIPNEIQRAVKHRAQRTDRYTRKAEDEYESDRNDDIDPRFDKRACLRLLVMSC